jgi:membrane-associated protein
MQRKARRCRDADCLASRRNAAMRPGIPRPFGLAPKCGARFVARLAKGTTLSFASLRAIIRILGPTQARFILLGALRRWVKLEDFTRGADMDFLAQFVDLVLHLDVHLAQMLQLYGNAVYAILFAIVFCETGLVIAPFLPGDSLLFVAGALAATSTTGGGLDIATLIAVLSAAAVLGDNCNYGVGRWAGRHILAWHSRLLNRTALEKTHEFYERHGGKTMIVARFIPLVRTFAPFVAGLGRMTYARFFAFDFAGALIWVISLSLAGYWFGNLAVVRNNLSLVILAIVAASFFPVLIGWFRHRLQPQR